MSQVSSKNKNKSEIKVEKIECIYCLKNYKNKYTLKNHLKICKKKIELEKKTPEISYKKSFEKKSQKNFEKSFEKYSHKSEIKENTFKKSKSKIEEKDNSFVSDRNLILIEKLEKLNEYYINKNNKLQEKIEELKEQVKNYSISQNNVLEAYRTQKEQTIALYKEQQKSAIVLNFVLKDTINVKQSNKELTQENEKLKKQISKLHYIINHSTSKNNVKKNISKTQEAKEIDKKKDDKYKYVESSESSSDDEPTSQQIIDITS